MFNSVFSLHQSFACCYCENEHLTVVILNTTSQEYSSKIPTCDRDFSFVIEAIVFRLNLCLNDLFCYTQLLFVCV